MAKYLDKVQILMSALKYFGIFHIPWCKNVLVDALSWLATLADNFLGQTYIKYLEAHSINEIEEV